MLKDFLKSGKRKKMIDLIYNMSQSEQKSFSEQLTPEQMRQLPQKLSHRISYLAIEDDTRYYHWHTTDLFFFKKMELTNFEILKLEGQSSSFFVSDAQIQNLLNYLFFDGHTFVRFPIAYVKAICTDFKFRSRFLTSFMLLFTF